jgi:hypothetical protein
VFGVLCWAHCLGQDSCPHVPQIPCSFDVDVFTVAQCMEVSPVIDDFESDLKGRDVYP